MTSRISQTWRRILKRIRNSLPPGASPEERRRVSLANLANQWGLEPSHLDSLRRLREHPSWAAYSRLLESVADQTFEQLCKGLPHDVYLAKCGEIQMLQRIRDLPELISTKVTELETDRARPDHAAHSGNLSRFLNTPWYDDPGHDLTTDASPGNGNGAHPV